MESVGSPAAVIGLMIHPLSQALETTGDEKWSGVHGSRHLAHFRGVLVTTTDRGLAMMCGGALHHLDQEDQIVGMPAPDAITTISELLTLPEDGLRHELLDGIHVVTPAPTWRHQHAVVELCFEIGGSLREDPELAVLVSPADLQLGPRTLVQPDLFVVRTNAAGESGPMLVIEVLSQSTAARDRGAKRRIYLDSGVAEYWIVDLDARLVERWRRDDDRPEIVDDRLDWAFGSGRAGSIDLPVMFDRIERKGRDKATQE